MNILKCKNGHTIDNCPRCQEVWDNENTEKIAYYKGLADGVKRFAWWKDGKEYVGTTGKSLRVALEEIEFQKNNE